MEIITEKIYLRQEEKTERIQELRNFAKKLKDKGLLTYMGISNHVIYCILVQYGLYYKDSRDISWELRNLLNTEIQAKICVNGAVKCLKKNWPGCHASDPHFRKCREILRQMGFWQYPDRPKGAKNGGKEETTYEPPLMENVDFFSLVVLFHVCKEELSDRHPDGQRLLPYSHGKTLPSMMPDHGGYLVQRVYDSMNLYFAEPIEDDEELAEQFWNHPDVVEADIDEIDEVDFIMGKFNLLISVAKPLVAKLYNYGKKVFRKTKKAAVKLQEDLFGIYRDDQIKAIPY